MRRVQGLLRSFDRVQQRSRWLGFRFAVMGKFGDDHGGALTTVIAYKRSSRSFPCCWSWSRCSDSCSAANPASSSAFLGSAVADFPIIGDQVQDSIHGCAAAASACRLDWSPLPGVPAA